MSPDFAAEFEAERDAFDEFMAALTAAARQATDAANALTDLVDAYMATGELYDPENPYDMTPDEIATTNEPTEIEVDE